MKRRSFSFAALSAFLFIAASAYAAEPQNAYFDSNGVKLHYLTAGKGEPVVLIHGFSASAAVNWVLPGVFNDLAAHYRVIAIDNRGHGASGKPHEPDKYGINMVEDVVRLLDHLKIQQAHIVGYSMGGFITAKLVTTHPERIISATMGGAGWRQERDNASPLMEALARSLEEGKGIGPLIRALTPSGAPAPTDEQIKTRNQLVMLTNDQKALAACIRGMAKLSITREQLERNSVPVLAIVGDRDPLKAGVDAMNGVMKNLKVVVVEGGDHISTFRSSKFRESLGAFLASHSLAAAAAK